jgi:hypothetical protein
MHAQVTKPLVFFKDPHSVCRRPTVFLSQSHRKGKFDVLKANSIAEKPPMGLNGNHAVNRAIQWSNHVNSSETAAAAATAAAATTAAATTAAVTTTVRGTVVPLHVVHFISKFIST